MAPIRVVVHGALGRMGQEIVKTLCTENKFGLVGAVDIKALEKHLELPNSSVRVPFSTSIEEIINECQPDVIIDFSTAKAVVLMASTAIKHRVNLVIGTTGLTPDVLEKIKTLAKKYDVGVVVASNFSLGAVIMIHFAKIAARYFDFAEIIEQHHHLKVDAPSGTALNTAKVMVESKGKPFCKPKEKEAANSRGQEINGVTIHSVRLPGIMARQEIIFGSLGQTFSLKHNTVSRQCYMPGILMAAGEVVKRKGSIYSLENLLGLQED